MITSATQQRNSQGNLQSETPSISIETSPIARIIDAAIIFSLRFTARMKRISAILIMSALMVFLAACAGGGNGDVSATATANPFAVTGLYGVAGNSYVTLSWNNPDAQIKSISISYQVSGTNNTRVTTTITDSPKIDASEIVQHNISGLTLDEYYDFTVSLILSGPDAGKEGAPPSIRNILVNADYDGDGENNFADVDADGNGLIEIATAQQLNQSRHNLLGSSFKSSAGGVGNANGCGNGGSVTACNGYELIADIYLTTYTNWQPIGRCPTLISGRCTDLDALFNAIFDGNSHTINDLTIANPAGSYANAAGLFGAISSDSVLRNIHIRSGNISDGGHNVGLLVGYARRASIINSSAEGAVDASGNNVGGLVGDGFDATITSSYAAGGAVSGDEEVGGLVGSGVDATITSSYAAGGDVSGTGNNVGGLVGWGLDATITSSYAAGGAVSGANSVGGLVGNGAIQVGGGAITSSYAAGGAVSGASGVGGLVGFGGGTVTASYWDNAVTITPSTGNSYGLPKTTSELQSPVHATGIYAMWTSLCPGTNRPAWYFGNSTQYPVLTCHPNSDSDRDGVPDITDTDDDNDGILDTADDLPLNPTESVDTDEDGVGDIADAFLEDPTESADTDEDGVGDNADACDEPGGLTGWTSNGSTDMDGDGCRDSDEDVDDNGDGLIEIRDDTDLDQVRDDLNGRTLAGNSDGCGGQNTGIIACNGYELTQNISLADYSDWQPIGGCPTLSSGRCADLDALFNTTFDGKDYIISNLTITNSNGDYDNATGLFGAIHADSILRNIHIRSGNISDGGRNVGLLVGYAQGAMIINSSTEGAVNASGNNVGGLVGDGDRATITSSYAAGGAVSGDNVVGGLVGVGQDATITSSYAAGGAVSGNLSVGGLVGYGQRAEITSSYAAGGDVSGGDFVGGLVGLGQFSTITSSYAAGGAVSGNLSVGGLVGYGQSANITSSYAAGGSVSGGSRVGGLVGDVGPDGAIMFSYWDSEKSGQESNGDDSLGVNKTTSELQAPTDGDLGIYSTWASDTCADGTTLRWEFGTASDYPALNCTPNGLPAQEHLRQR